MRKLQLPTFDLTKVVERVKSEHPDWSQDRLDNAVLEYYQFLALSKATAAAGIIPGKDADEIWHVHIIHTQDYVKDCQSYFGYYLHHIPTGEASLEQLRRCDALYRASFNRGILSAAPCDGGACKCAIIHGKEDSSFFTSHMHV